MAIATKSERIQLVARPQEVARWKLAADDAGVSLSELLRRAADGYVRDAGTPRLGAGPFTPRAA